MRALEMLPYVLVMAACAPAPAQGEGEIDKDSISVHRVRRGDMPVRLMAAGEITSLSPPEVTATVPSGATPAPQVGQRASVQVKPPEVKIGRVLLFAVEPGGEFARRRTVRFGRISGALIEVTGSLAADEMVIVTDTTKWNTYERVRLK